MKPIKFYSHPQYLRFGGNKLKNCCKFQEPILDEPLAETWELADHQLHSSVISHGEFKGKTLKELIKSKKLDIFGSYDFISGNSFPIMIRLLDINEELPPAVHPGHQYVSDNSLTDGGKYEVAYVLETSSNEAAFYCGIKDEISLERIENYAHSGKSFSIMNKFNTKAGDCFYVEPGVLHSWGRGNLIYEVHTTSNLIYALDWLSWDKDKRRRDSDIKHLKQNLIGKTKENNKTKLEVKGNSYILCKTNYFVLERMAVDEKLELTENEDRFSVYTIIEGAGHIHSEGECLFEMRKYETVLIPAKCKNAVFNCNGKATLLKVYLPVSQFGGEKN